MTNEKVYTLKTLRAMMTGGSVLSHNKAEIVVTARHEEFGEIRGQVASIASHGVAVAYRSGDPLAVVFVPLEDLLHAEVVW